MHIRIYFYTMATKTTEYHIYKGHSEGLTSVTVHLLGGSGPTQNHSNVVPPSLCWQMRTTTGGLPDSVSHSVKTFSLSFVSDLNPYLFDLDLCKLR